MLDQVTLNHGDPLITRLTAFKDKLLYLSGSGLLAI